MNKLLFKPYCPVGSAAQANKYHHFYLCGTHHRLLDFAFAGKLDKQALLLIVIFRPQTASLHSEDQLGPFMLAIR